MAQERKLDIFDLLRAADKRDGDWFARQSPEAQKEFAPPVVLRWASTVTDGTNEALYTLWTVNERVNVHLFDLHRHPELVYRLLASCGLGKALKHQWIPQGKRQGISNKAFDLLASVYPDANNRELAMLMGKYTKDSFRELVQDCGIQPDAAKEVMKAYDKFNA